jgi:hypothetical protein
MKTKIKVYTLASDDDTGTKAEVFTTERAAVESLIDRLKYTPTDEERQELIDAYFDPERGFYEDICEFKSDYDTFSIDEQTIEIDLLDALAVNYDDLLVLTRACNEAAGYMEFCVNNYDHDYSAEELEKVKTQLRGFDAMFKRLSAIRANRIILSAKE